MKVNILEILVDAAALEVEIGAVGDAVKNAKAGDVLDVPLPGSGVVLTINHRRVRFTHIPVTVE